MPDPIVCPHCQEHLDIPVEYHGRQVRCANCQNTFVATPEGDMPVVHRLPDRRSGAGGHTSRTHDDRPRSARRVHDDEGDVPPRRSNVPVVLGLMFVVFTIGGCCGGLNLFSALQFNPTMKEYPSPEGKFKVEFPAENPVSGPTTNPADEKLTGVQVTAGREFGQEKYTVRVYELKAEWRKLPPADALEKVAKAELDALGVAGQPPPRQETNVKHQGFPAHDLFVEGGNGFTGRDTMMRCILAGSRVYVVIVQAQKVQTQYWWVRRYYLSFEITDPAAKPPDDEPKKDAEKKERKQD